MGALLTESRPKAPARLAGSAVLACQSDSRLVELVRDGHERAFEAIVDRYRRPLVRYCARILPESRTEDAVQQAFINAHAALQASAEPLQLKPWLYTITRNAALNMLRQNGWNYEQIPADFDGVQRPDQAVEQKIQLQRTVAAVNELPDRQRNAIVMREFEGRSYDEIALALGTGDGAVRQLLNRARGTLRAVATAVMPPPLVARAAASLPPSDGRRVAEIVGGLGAAGMAKVGATVVVAGSLVVGAVEAPLPLGNHHSSKAKATVVAPKKAAASAVDPPTAAAIHLGNRAQAGRHENGASGRSRHGSSQGHQGSSNSGRGSHDSNGRSGSGDDRSGSDDRTTSGEQRSGSDDGGRSGSGETTSGSGGTSGSGSDDSTSGSGSGSSGSSGSDDVATATAPDSGSSGSSGSDDGLSGTSGSSSSGTSGSSDSGSSGSGGSTTSGSGTSGSDSGTSGSGSDDPTSTHD